MVFSLEVPVCVTAVQLFILFSLEVLIRLQPDFNRFGETCETAGRNVPYIVVSNLQHKKGSIFELNFIFSWLHFFHMSLVWHYPSHVWAWPCQSSLFTSLASIITAFLFSHWESWFITGYYHVFTKTAYCITAHRLSRHYGFVGKAAKVCLPQFLKILASARARMCQLCHFLHSLNSSVVLWQSAELTKCFCSLPCLDVKILNIFWGGESGV